MEVLACLRTEMAYDWDNKKWVGRVIEREKEKWEAREYITRGEKLENRDIHETIIERKKGRIADRSTVDI